MLFICKKFCEIKIKNFNCVHLFLKTAYNIKKKGTSRQRFPQYPQTMEKNVENATVSTP